MGMHTIIADKNLPTHYQIMSDEELLEWKKQLHTEGRSLSAEESQRLSKKHSNVSLSETVLKMRKEGY